MNYEEKRALHIEISQMLADAGLNQGEIKRIVEEEIKNKVERAVEQVIKKLNSETSSGDYFDEQIKRLLRNTYFNNGAFRNAVKEELNDRVIYVSIKDKDSIKVIE
jgi:SOS response regulatory protein OraA/RecX